LGCWLLGTEPVLALTGRRGDPKRLEEAGFTFRFPTVHEALADLYPPVARREGVAMMAKAR
jgi:NAD dependent epimerase/dehydratase family enzyme